MSKYSDGHEAGYVEGYEEGCKDTTAHYDQMVNSTSHPPEPSPAKWLEVSVDSKGAGHTYRLRVPGGWLYRTVTYRWPEYHRNAEGAFDWTPTGEPWTTKTENMAMEILTQTTVFVPEAA